MWDLHACHEGGGANAILQLQQPYKVRLYTTHQPPPPPPNECAFPSLEAMYTHSFHSEVGVQKGGALSDPPGLHRPSGVVLFQVGGLAGAAQRVGAPRVGPDIHSREEVIQGRVAQVPRHLR